MPFAEYRDFDHCVAKNRDKRDPKAYCAMIMRKVKKGSGQQAFSWRALEEAKQKDRFIKQ